MRVIVVVSGRVSYEKVIILSVENTSTKLKSRKSLIRVLPIPPHVQWNGRTRRRGVKRELYDISLNADENSNNWSNPGLLGPCCVFVLAIVQTAAQNLSNRLPRPFFHCFRMHQLALRTGHMHVQVPGKVTLLYFASVVRRRDIEQLIPLLRYDQMFQFLLELGKTTSAKECLTII